MNCHLLQLELKLLHTTYDVTQIQRTPKVQISKKLCSLMKNVNEWS